MDILRELEIFQSFEKKMEPSNQTVTSAARISELEVFEGVEALLSTEDRLWIESVLTQPSSTYTSPLEFDSSKLMEEIMGPTVIVEPAEPVLNMQSFNIDQYPNFTDLSPAMADHDEESVFLASPARNASSEYNTTDGSFLLTESEFLTRPASNASSESSNTDESFTLMDSNLNFNFQVNQLETLPTQILQEPEQEEKKPKKRGRKPKSESGLTIREQRRQKRMKVYEMPPLVDAEEEKKRKNAMNAKRHRDIAKQRMLTAEATLETVKKERDQLKREVEELKKNELNLKQQLQNQNPNIFFQAYVQS